MRQKHAGAVGWCGNNAKLLNFCVMVCLFAVVSGSAGTASKALEGKKIEGMLIDDGQSGSRGYSEGGLVMSNTTVLNFVAVDTMGNAFGPASRGVKPIAYDSATGIVALLHRGATTYAASTGQLWYNVSRNGGLTWRRVAGAINTGVANSLRYPSCAISNPNNSSDTTNVLMLFAAPLLNATPAFGLMGYGLDIPIGGGNGFGFESIGENQTFWSNSHIWTTHGGPDINWVTYRYSGGTPADLWRYHTTDFATAVEGVPPTWAASNFEVGFGLDIAAMERKGKHYMGKWGPFAGDPNSTTIDNVGYSVSTDGGVNWGAWVRPQPDWRSAVGLPLGVDWWSYGGPGAYSKEMVVDANNRVHFFGVVFDTLTLGRSIVEVYETGSGWAGKLITNDLKESTALNYPGTAGDLNQMGNHLNASITTTGDVMALIWLDAAVQSETMTDIWFSWRRITDANWSAPLNLTQTPSFAELLLHAAPTLRKDANGWTMFIGRCYEDGVTSYPPESGNRTVFYVAPYSWTATGVSENEGRPQTFSLSQNYPNPFNPSTRIAYEIPSRNEVRLAVYNVLGEQVATLVDEFKEAGSYEVEFSGSGLASGVYFYTLKAGQFVDTRKLLLIK